MKAQVDEKYFQERGWWTPMQIRDSLYDFTAEMTKDYVNHIRLLAQAEQTRRKGLPEKYVECPFCRGCHEQKGNVESLCEKHEAQLAPFFYDHRSKS